MPEDKLREALAAYAHEAWSGWMKYVSSKAKEHGQYRGQGREMSGWLPVGLRDRWARQMNTPYDELPESEKELGRAEADKIIAILDDHIDEELADIAKERLEDKRESEGVGIGNLAAVRMGNPAEVPPYAKRKVEKVPSLIAAPQLKRDVEE